MCNAIFHEIKWIMDSTWNTPLDWNIEIYYKSDLNLVSSLFNMYQQKKNCNQTVLWEIGTRFLFRCMLNM